MIKNLSQLAPYLADEDKARALFEKLRWPSGPFCPHCLTGEKIYKIESAKVRKGLYKCGNCRKQFTVTVGTVLEGSHIPLGKWLYAFYLMCSSKKGVSASQLSRQLGISFKSAWFMCHRVRLAMAEPPLAGRLGGAGGVVEIDETYIGGKARNNPHKGRKRRKKSIVVTMIDREGDARTFPVPEVRKTPMTWLIGQNVHPDTHIVTDSHSAYFDLHEFYRSHQSVNHSREYVRGLVHVNFAESYHSLLKRGLMGTFHHVSDKHLPRYLREFEFRWNRRHDTDGERTMAAIIAARGKRLIYKQPTRKRGRPSKAELARLTDRRRNPRPSLN